MTAEGWKLRSLLRVSLAPLIVVCFVVLALLTGLSALLIRDVYAVTVMRSENEWLAASISASEVAIARFSHDGTPSSGVGFVWAYHKECFPTERAWFWARIREPSEVLARWAQDSYMQCLGDYARIERRKRGWRPPGGGQVGSKPGVPQNNRMQLTSGEYMWKARTYVRAASS
jgi:hypothetical protein